MWPYYSLSVRGGVPPYEGKLGFSRGKGREDGIFKPEATSFPGFLILPPCGKMRDPGNEVEPEDAQCGNMDVFWSSTFYLLVATLYF